MAAPAAGPMRQGQHDLGAPSAETLTAEEACKICGCTRRALQKRAKAGQLRGRLIPRSDGTPGTLWLLDAGDVVAFALELQARRARMGRTRGAP